jgi:hypothetical protein
MDDFIKDYLLPSNDSHDLESHAYERIPRHAKVRLCAAESLHNSHPCLWTEEPSSSCTI